MSIKRPEGGEHYEPPNEQPEAKREPEKPVQEILEDWIEFPRLKILTEDEETFTVEYDGRETKVNKAEIKHQGAAFHPGGGGAPSMGLRLQMKQVLQPMHGFFLDRDIPQEFREVMIFHELREAEYGGEDAHQRAVHDEILYVIKHFAPELRKQYFEFAEKEREEKSPQRKLNPEELLQLIEANGLQIWSHNFETFDEDKEPEDGDELFPSWSNEIEVVLPETRKKALIVIEEIDNEGNYETSIQLEPYEFGSEVKLRFDNRNPRTFQRSVLRITEKAKALLEEANKEKG